MSYHNTTNLNGEELKEAKRNAVTQEENVIDIFEHLTFVYGKEQLLTPSRIESQWINLLRGRKRFPPITSIRRALTNLTKNIFYNFILLSHVSFCITCCWRCGCTSPNIINFIIISSYII